MKVKVVYSWEMGISEHVLDLDKLDEWRLKHRNLRILSITQFSEFVEPTEEQKKQIDSAYQAQWDELSKYLPSEPMPDESMTEWEKKELEAKFMAKYQGKAVLNTEEETEDRNITAAIIIVCIMVSLACLKYIVL